jgi:hypothetical protein
VFPDCINEDSPLSSRVPSGEVPVFQVEHLHRRSKAGFWRVDRNCGLADYLRPCLVIQLLQESKSAIGSTSPYYAHRWLPLGHDGFLPDQPRVSVHLSIPEAFSGPDPGYLCFTHILQVKPIKRYENKPPCPYRLLNELRLRET